LDAENRRRYRLVADEAFAELMSARTAWPPFASAHEGFAVMLEEVDELKAHVWTKQKNRDLAEMKKEALQVAAMAMSIAADCCNEQLMERERNYCPIDEAVTEATGDERRGLNFVDYRP